MCPLFLSDFSKTWILYIFSKNTQISYLTKILLIGAKVLHADRQTDMTKLILHFRDFAVALTVTDLAEFILFTLEFLIISF
jgi:hypothetical protein